MLTGTEILNRIKTGEIEISDFDMNRLNPNSYNLRIGNTVSMYKNIGCNGQYLDSREENEIETIEIPEEGIVLKPGVLYLAHTMETTYAKDLIPCIDGRSSFARLGMEVHRTAGFGDIGVRLQWTLEITVVHPLKIYPYQEICQIYFEKPNGSTDIQYAGKYQNSKGTVASKSYLDS